MVSYCLKGKVITNNKQPVDGLKILAYDDDPLLNPDDFLGESITNQKGMFRIEFDESKFKKFWEALEGSPDIFLVVKDKNQNEILKTRVAQTRKEIGYHIKLDDHVPNPNAPDIYGGNFRRMISMLDDVGSLIGLENQINLDMLQDPDLPDELRMRFQEFVDGFDERNRNFEHIVAMMNGLMVSVLEEAAQRQMGDIGPLPRRRHIGYDGPQVPRYPRGTSYNQVIIWPRNEEFRWA